MMYNVYLVVSTNYTAPTQIYSKSNRKSSSTDDCAQITLKEFSISVFDLRCACFASSEFAE